MVNAFLAMGYMFAAKAYQQGPFRAYFCFFLFLFTFRGISRYNREPGASSLAPVKADGV